MEGYYNVGHLSLELLTQVTLGEVVGNTGEVDHRGLKKEIWRHPRTRGGSMTKLMLKVFWHLLTQWKIHLITSGEKNLYTTIWPQGPVESTIETHIIGAHHVHTQVKEEGLM